MARRRRRMAWIMAGLVLFVTLVSGFEIAREADHVCTGEDCRICARITALRNVLRVVTLAVLGAAAATAFRLRTGETAQRTRSVPAPSPVFLKVRLLN